MRELQLLVVVTGVAMLGAGCGKAAGETVVYSADSEELASATVSPEGVWETVPAWGNDTAWLPFPPQVTLALEHPLGRQPRVVLVYLSFEMSGAEPALAAGDLARFVEVTDTTLVVRNDTNGHYYCRVVAF